MVDQDELIDLVTRCRPVESVWSSISTTIIALGFNEISGLIFVDFLLMSAEPSRSPPIYPEVSVIESRTVLIGKTSTLACAMSASCESISRTCKVFVDLPSVSFIRLTCQRLHSEVNVK